MEYKVGEFYKNTLHDVFKINGIFTIHYFKYGKNFSFPSESHDFWEMVFIDSGSAKITSDNKTFVLNQSEAVFHKPNVAHTIATGDEFCNSVIVSFEASGRMLNFFEDKTLLFSAYEKELLQKIVLEGNHCFKGKLNLVNQKKLEKRDDAPFGSEQVIKNCLELLLISLFRNNYEQLNTDNEISYVSAHAEQIVQKILEILNKNLCSSINLDTISKELFFSKTYIKSVFKRQTGSSIIQYYNKMKINEAKRLISLNCYSFTEISVRMGFTSVHYFTRLFKSIAEMTPSEYRDSIKADNVLD